MNDVMGVGCDVMGGGIRRHSCNTPTVIPATPPPSFPRRRESGRAIHESFSECIQ